MLHWYRLKCTIVYQKCAHVIFRYLDLVNNSSMQLLYLKLCHAFADLRTYSTPQPSFMPDLDSTLRQIAQWRHIITTDLTSAFYQTPLARESTKYCGVATPFRGVRVYTRSAMGMPGSETA